MGQTTAFRNDVLKTSVLVLGECKPANEARYIHGEFGKGTWTFYGGHDPEDNQHRVGDPPTDLSLHPNSPGYRLILNNILFPAANTIKACSRWRRPSFVTIKTASTLSKSSSIELTISMPSSFISRV